MDPVIYSAGLFHTFMKLIITICLMSLIGFSGLMMAILQTSEKRSNRIGMGLAGGFLLIIACVMTFLTYRTITTGSMSVAARLKDKTVANENCGNGGSCTRYILEMTTVNKTIDFNVPQIAYDRAQLDTCYQVTYYPVTSLFSEPVVNSSYEIVANTMRVEAVSASSCSP